MDGTLEGKQHPMTTPQWQNLPVPPNSGGRDWASFSADPRDPQFQQLRSSDADRGTAAAMLADAFADGRLDKDEYDQRLNQAMSSKSLGELVPVLSDLTVDRTESNCGTAQGFAARSRSGMIGPFPRWWLGLAVMLNAIWLMTCLTSGELIYYWPMWPMLGTAIPLIMGVVSGGGRRQRQQDQNQQLPPAPGNDLR